MPKALVRVLKWVGIAIGGLVGLIVVALVVVWFLAGSKINKTFDIEVKPVTVPTDEVSIARGRHVVRSFGLCQECHGDNLEGDIMDDDPVFGRLVGRNLTSGKGGIGGSRSDLDFVRAIRHGVGTNGKSLIIMPADTFYYLSDADLGATIAYLKTLPPIDNELPGTRLGPLGRLFSLTSSSILVAGGIDHTGPRPAEPPPGVTAEYGKYLGRSCLFCHGDDLSGEGGGVVGLPPPNLTIGGRLGSWSEADFFRTMRTGVTPRGHELDSVEMPWKSFARLTDDELRAIWLYLNSVPSVVTEK